MYTLIYTLLLSSGETIGTEWLDQGVSATAYVFFKLSDACSWEFLLFSSVGWFPPDSSPELRIPLQLNTPIHSVSPIRSAAVSFNQSFSTCQTLKIASPIFRSPTSNPISSSLQQNIHHLFRIPTSTDRMHNPTLCWQRSWTLMTDPNSISGSWQWIVDYGGTRSRWELITDSKINKTAWHNIPITSGIHCTSVRPGWGIPRMWFFLRFLCFSCQKGFCSFTFLLSQLAKSNRTILTNGLSKTIDWLMNHHQCLDPGGNSCSMLCSTPL